MNEITICMDFKEFISLCESAPLEYKVLRRPTQFYNLSYVPLGQRLASEAEEKFKKGRIGLIAFLRKQEPGFRALIDGVEYLRSIDGVFKLGKFPLSGFRGSAIGQRELYSPHALKKYTSFLKKNPGRDTEAVTIKGTADDYRVVDGHHRMEAYKRAGRSEVPAWTEIGARVLAR